MKFRKFISLSAALISVSLGISALPCSAALSLGDVDKNGIIDGKDATGILSYYAAVSANKEGALNAEQQTAADVDQDGKIDGVDATTVLSYYASTSVGLADSLEYYVQNRRAPLDVYPTGLESEEQARSFVSGSWLLMPQGQPPQTDESVLSLKLEGDSAEIAISKGEKKGTVKSGLTMKNLYDTPRGCYNLISTVPPTSLEYSSLSVPMSYTSAMDIQYLGANVNGRYVIAVNLVGESISPLELMLGDQQADNDTWIFTQYGNNVLHKPDVLEHASMRVKDKTFYAYRWLDTGDSVYLQEMNTKPVEITGQDGSKATALEFSYPLNGHAMVAVQYPIESDLTKTDCDTYRPGLVKVTTDKNGNITELKPLKNSVRGMYQE